METHVSLNVRQILRSLENLSALRIEELNIKSLSLLTLPSQFKFYFVTI